MHDSGWGDQHGAFVVLMVAAAAVGSEEPADSQPVDGIGLAGSVALARHQGAGSSR